MKSEPEIILDDFLEPDTVINPGDNPVVQKAVEEALAERQKQDIALVEALAEAKRANMAKTEFLSHMSHDIRTPINGILGMLAIGDKNPDNMEKQQECREKIRTAAEHLLSLINDILDISKLESGDLTFAEESFHMHDVVNNCIEILRPQAEEEGIRIEKDYQVMKHPDLIGSPLHVRQILINIIGNGVKYNRIGGKVSVRLEELSYAKDENSALFRFVITDDGIGMSEEFLKHIFEPFTQEGNDARTKYNGSGLGMSITKSLVEQMGGSITVESEPGIGSRFNVILPFKVNKEYRKPEVRQKEEANINIAGMRVLLVEDNPLNREIAQYMLEDAGAIVINAVNGMEAVSIFSESQPGEIECILMDIMMPIMDGLEATHMIRSMEKEDAGTIPIIALSANAFAEDVEKAKQSGMNMHLAKPLDTNQMLRAIASYRK